MRYVQHPSSNKVLGAPKNWDQTKGECGALPVTVIDTTNGPAMVSYWQPNDAERDMIARGSKVMLYVFGGMHPPVAVEVDPAA